MVKLISSWVCATSLFLLDWRAKFWQIMCNKWKIVHPIFIQKVFILQITFEAPRRVGGWKEGPKVGWL
jgi:hypothetical protein